MKLLVTGGAGYVGSHCVKHLCDHGHGVVVLDNLCQGHRAAVDERASLLEGDLADTDLLERLFADQRIDAVLHFAAHLEVGESVAKPLKYYDNNVTRTIGLLRAMRDADVKRIIFSSTAAVYGVPPDVPITEDMHKAPINPYGHTKLAMEWALADCATAWGLAATALRYFNAAGAAADASIGEDHDPEPHLIPIILQVALGRRASIRIFGRDYPTPDGTCVRDYVHVEDLASAHRLALERLEPGRFNAYNVGTGSGFSVLEVIEAARRVTGHAIPAVDAPRRPGDPPALFAASDRIRTALDWSPAYTDVESILRTAWAWHQAHPNGYDD